MNARAICLVPKFRLGLLVFEVLISASRDALLVVILLMFELFVQQLVITSGVLLSLLSAYRYLRLSLSLVSL